ncbi:MAG TPA: hypothetical protein VHP33_00025 [Polyangiaceae bacterium]|nr:hypothetical protein [Polyangiaceae bacterium]
MTRTALASCTALPLLTLTALLGSACSRASAPDASHAREPHGPAPAHASPTSAPGDVARSEGYSSAEKSASAPPAPAAARDSGGSADGAFRPSPAPPREERPGLGTEWGETRDSRVSSAPFERQDYSTPLSTASFFYNDESGVRAMLGSSYWDRRTDGISTARGAITIRVVDDSGSPLPTFSAGGRSYVLGNDGARYAIRIENQTGARFEAVATVDGLDVIDGQPGSFEKRGYLVAPWSTVEIDGFRRSEAQVAAFRFGKVRDSYAAKRGSDRNVGVIGVAVFQERGSSWPWTQRELQRRDSADAFPGRFAPAP